jgi:Flp pilus assembly pilin Flp
MARDQEHLCDGVYASHDGYQIWLAANHHENRVIALEPSVLRQLIAYAKRIGMDTGGTTSVEYGVIALIVALALLVGLHAFGHLVSQPFQAASTAMTGS